VCSSDLVVEGVRSTYGRSPHFLPSADPPSDIVNGGCQSQAAPQRDENERDVGRMQMMPVQDVDHGGVLT
jgi:hypothetical protein